MQQEFLRMRESLLIQVLAEPPSLPGPPVHVNWHHAVGSE